MKKHTIEISQRLKKSMEESEKSYGEISAITNIPKSAIHRYINGKTPKIPIDRLEKIANAIGVSAKWVMGWEEEEQKKNDIQADIILRMRSDSDFSLRSRKQRSED